MFLTSTEDKNLGKFYPLESAFYFYFEEIEKKIQFHVIFKHSQ